MCIWKWTKRLTLAAVVLGVAGFAMFGRDVYSYVSSSGRWIQESVEDSVPFEFQLERARHLLEEIVPKMHESIEDIAEEEFEVATLETEVRAERQSVGEERLRIQTLRGALKDEDRVSFRFGTEREYTKAQVVEELGRRFEHFQTAEAVLASKEKLLDTRHAALAAAKKKLDAMRVQRLELAAQIESLESQYRLAQAQSSTATFELDDSKLAQIKKVIGDLRKRLDVSQRVLAHESHFIENIEVETVDEESLLEAIDGHLAKETQSL